MVAPDLVQSREMMPLAMVTVLPLSVRVTAGPVPVPPPAMFPQASQPVSSQIVRVNKQFAQNDLTAKIGAGQGVRRGLITGTRMCMT